MQENEKKVDQSWKETAAKEKKEQLETINNQNQVPQANFYTFITSLSMQALMHLGEIENPVTNKKETDKEQARYLIDILDILKDKTKGNLDENEKQLIETATYELKMKFAALGN